MHVSLTSHYLCHSALSSETAVCPSRAHVHCAAGGDREERKRLSVIENVMAAGKNTHRIVVPVQGFHMIEGFSSVDVPKRAPEKRQGGWLSGTQHVTSVIPEAVAGADAGSPGWVLQHVAMVETVGVALDGVRGHRLPLESEDELTFSTTSPPSAV